MASSDLVGHAAAPFEAPQVLDGMTLRDRNDVRRHIRDRVGQHIYAARRPIRSDSAHTAITIRTISADAVNPLVGENDMPVEMLQVDVWTQGSDADWRAYITGKLVRMAVNGYFGLWGTSQVTGCTVRRQSMLTTPPSEGTDDWPYRWSLDLEVMHYEAAAVYPVTPLVARITARPRTGGGVAMTAAGSSVPEGREIEAVTWTIRASQGGAVLLTVTGAPGELVDTLTEQGVVWDFVATGLPGTFWIDLELTDSAGAVASAGASYGG